MEYLKREQCNWRIIFILINLFIYFFVLFFFLIYKFLKSKTTHKPNSTYVKIFNDYFSIHRSINIYVYIYINGYNIFWKGIHQTASCDCLLLLLFFFYKFNFFYSILIKKNYTCVPILNPPPSSLPIPSLWVVPVH